MKYLPDNRGISLAMTIGLLLLLVTLTVTINELVIRALRASHQIEAADKAYFAAEAGIEDALYELSAHSAGYETATLGTGNVRQGDFGGGLRWENEWQIASSGANDCADFDPWTGYTPTFCGRIYEDQREVISLFWDEALTGGVDVNGINTEPAAISSLGFWKFMIRFRPPPDLVATYPSAFPNPDPINIDNDGDFDPSNPSGTLNEDGADPTAYPPNPCPYSGSVLVADNDCDTLEDEDSPQDPIFLWSVLDDSGHSFQPLRGCKGEANHSSHSSLPNAIPCESTFSYNFGEPYIELNYASDYGVNQLGLSSTLQNFLSSYSAGTEMRVEILPVAPFEVINVGATGDEPDRIRLPYFEYAVEYGEGFLNRLPDTRFTIRSDGYYQDFKQSITTTVAPETATRLLDLTIIQQ